MKSLLILGLALCLLTFLRPAEAQTYPCSNPGPGEVVVGQTQGGNGLAPMQLCQRAGAQSSQPEIQWETRWGAIATDEPHGVLGVSNNQLTRSVAEQAAIADCQAKGGSPCKLELPYQNSCAAFTVSDSGYNTAADITVGMAAQRGMMTCKNAGESNCRTYYTGCSSPVRAR
jgi:hypothetical protein